MAHKGHYVNLVILANRALNFQNREPDASWVSWLKSMGTAALSGLNKFALSIRWSICLALTVETGIRNLKVI
jgi:hypothetical protein